MKRNHSGAITTALAVLAVGLGLALGMRPWHVYHTQQEETAQATAEMKAAERARAELLDQESEAKSSLGRQRLARDLGYIKKGEVPAN